MSTACKRISLIAEGSRGDCQPYVALAKGLKDAGFALQVLTNVNHCDTYKTFGINARGVFSDFEGFLQSDRTARDTLASGDVLKFTTLLAAAQLPNYEMELTKCCAAIEEFKPDLMMYGILSRLVATNISFQFGIPAVPALLQWISPSRFQQSLLLEPSCLPGCCHLAAHYLTGAFYLRSQAPFVQIQKKVLPDIEPYTNSLVKQNVNLRQSLLKPIVGGSSLLNKVAPDASPDSTPLITGAWVIDAAEQTRLIHAGNTKMFGSMKDTEDTLAFLDEAAGPPPVYFGWGSMIAISPEHMVRLAVKSLILVGRRGIILGGGAKLQESMLEGEPELREYASKNVRFVSSAPHEVLFPKCAAVVHHGGAGTSIAALRSGVAQVITPCIVDQFYHAAKVNELKVGVGLPKFQNCTVEKLAEALKEVLTNSNIQENARAYAEELHKECESSIALTVNEIRRTFEEEIDTGKWKTKFEARKLLFKTSKQAMVEPTCWTWMRKIFFSRAPDDFLPWTQ